VGDVRWAAFASCSFPQPVRTFWFCWRRSTCLLVTRAAGDVRAGGQRWTRRFEPSLPSAAGFVTCILAAFWMLRDAGVRTYLGTDGTLTLVTVERGVHWHGDTLRLLA